jgi:hypothetical protein
MSIIPNFTSSTLSKKYEVNSNFNIFIKPQNSCFTNRYFKILHKIKDKLTTITTGYIKKNVRSFFPLPRSPRTPPWPWRPQPQLPPPRPPSLLPAPPLPPLPPQVHRIAGSTEASERHRDGEARQPTAARGGRLWTLDMCRALAAPSRHLEEDACLHHSL